MTQARDHGSGKYVAILRPNKDVPDDIGASLLHKTEVQLSIVMEPLSADASQFVVRIQHDEQGRPDTVFEVGHKLISRCLIFAATVFIVTHEGSTQKSESLIREIVSILKDKKLSPPLEELEHKQYIELCNKVAEDVFLAKESEIENPRDNMQFTLSVARVLTSLNILLGGLGASFKTYDSTKIPGDSTNSVGLTFYHEKTRDLTVEAFFPRKDPSGLN